MLAATLVMILPAPAAVAAPGINKTVNFQGKVTNTDGTNVANGSYTFVFKLYAQQAPGGTAIWTETKSLTVTDGIFQTNLGSTTSLPGSVDFNTDNIFLGMSFNGDPEMEPRIQFTASPYAFNTDKLDGLDSTQFARTDANNTLTGTQTIQNSSALALNVQNATGRSALNVDTTTGRLTVGNVTTTAGAGLQGSLVLADGTIDGYGATIQTAAALSGNATFQLPGGVSGTFAICTSASVCSGYQAAGSYLAKDAADTSSAAVTAGNFLYSFSNSSLAVASGVLKLDNATNTGSALSVTASGNPGASQALILANNTNGAPSGGLIDLQTSGTSRFRVDAAGAVTTSSTINGQTVSSAASFTGTVAVATSVSAPLAVLTGAASGNNVLTAQVTGDTNPRLAATAGGQLNFGSGTGATDVSLSRNGAGVLAVGGSLTTSGTVTIQGSNALTVGTTGTSTGAVLFKGATAASGTITVVGQANPTGSQTITLPDETGVVCLQGKASCGFLTGAVNDYIQNQNTAAQATSNFWISGTGRSDTAMVAPLFNTADVASGASAGLTIRSGNVASGLASSGNVTIDAGSTAGTGGTVSIGGANAGSLVLGRAGANFSLQGVAGASGSSIAASSGGFATTLKFAAPGVNTTLNFPASSTGGTYTICTSDGASCGSATYLRKNTALESSSANLTAGQYLYNFSNTGSLASNVLQIDNGAGTGSALRVAASAAPGAASALIYGKLTATGGNLLDLLSGTSGNEVSRFAVDANGNLTQTGGSSTTTTVNGQRISSAASFTGTVTAANTLTVAAGGLTVSAGGANISGGINNNAGGITNTGAIAGATTGAFNSTVTLSGTGANELAITGAPLAAANSSLVQLGGAIAGGNAVVDGGTYLGLNAPNIGAGSAADFMNFQMGGTTRFKLTNAGNITAGTYNGQTISSAASFTGTVAVATGLTVTSGGATVTAGGLTVTAGGASIAGGINNNTGGISNAGAIGGATNITLNGTISGGTTYTASASLQAPAFDTASATGLTIGGTNASSVTVGNDAAGFTLQGNGGSVIRSTVIGNTTTVAFDTPAGDTTLVFPASATPGTYTICTTDVNSCGAIYGSTGSFLKKNNQDTSSTAVAGNLYTFSNTDTGVSAGVLSLSNAGTSSALSVTSSANPAAGQALIFANNTNVAASGNLIGLSAGGSSKFSVTAAGAVTQAGSLTVSAGGASISGGLNNNSGGVTNAGVVSGVTNISLNGTISGGTTYSAQTAVQAPAFDTAGAGTLTIGGTNASSVTIGQTDVSFLLQGNQLASLTSTNGVTGFKTTVDFTATTGSDKTISFPNETGVVCLQNSTNCGFASAANFLAKNPSANEASTSNFAGYQYSFTQSSTGAAGVLSLANSGTNSGLSILQNTTPSAGQAALLVNAAIAVTGNLVDFQLNGASRFSVTTTGVATVANGLTVTTGGLTVSAGGASITGALTTTGVANINHNASTNTTDIGTGTTSGQISIGGGSAPLAINSTNFDVSSAGALSGITTISTSGAINGQTISSAAVFTGTVGIQGANALTLGMTGTNTGVIEFKGSIAASNSISLAGQSNPAANRTIFLPDEGGVVCLQGQTSCGFLTGAATDFIQNQNTAAQTTANFWISGSGRADTSILTPKLDTASAVALNIGDATTPTTTQINLNQNTAVSSGKTLTFQGGASDFDQSASSGTFKTGFGAATINGITTVQPSTNASAFNVTAGAGGGSVLKVDTSNSRVGVNLGAGSFGLGSGVNGLDVNGALRLGGLGGPGYVDTVVTPVGSAVPSKINIPVYDPGAFGQILAFGISSSAASPAATSARGLVVFDQRGYQSGLFGSAGSYTATPHQPSIGVFSPDENDIFGFSWEGTVDTAYLKSTDNNLNIRLGSGNLDVLTAQNVLGVAAVGIGNTAPSYRLDVNGDTNISSGSSYRIGGTAICASAGCTASSASAILNQTATDQSASFRIGGTGQITSSSTTANAMNVTANSLQTGTALNVMSNALTTGNAFKVTSASNTVANTSWSSVMLDVSSVQATTAVSSGLVAGLDVQFTQAAAVDGNNETVANLAVKQNNSATADNTFNSILKLANNDTGSGTQITVVDAVNISGANISNGINFSGTFNSNLITSTNFSVSQGGAIVGVGVNSGSGVIQGIGGLTVNGAASSINANSNFATSINTGTSTGTVTIGGGSAPLVIDSTNFDVSSAGALSGITTITTSSTINTNTFTGSGLTFGSAATATVQSASGQTLQVGVTGNTLALKGDASTTLAATNGGNTTTIGFVSPTANVAYNFGTASAGTYTVCTTAGVCSGYAPSTGGTGYIQNSTSQQSSANFNIDGTGVVQGLTVGGTTAGSATTTADLVFGSNAATGRTMKVLAAAASTNGDALTIRAGDGGSGNQAGGNLVLQGGVATGTGVGGSVIVKSQTNSTTAFMVQNSSGTAILTVDTLSSSGTGLVLIGDGTNGATFGTSRELSFTGTARHQKAIRLTAEYAGATLLADGVSNNGTMTAGTDIGQSPYLNYYQWTSGQATSQDYDIVITVPVPDDFDSWGTAAPSFMVYGDSTSTINLSVYGTNGIVETNYNGTSVGILSTIWTSVTLSPGTLSQTYTPGSNMVIRIHMTTPQNKVARIGTITFPYKSKW